MGKIHLHLLFFCGILCQGIFATFSDKDTRLSSDVLIRKRRVINHLPHGRVPTRIEQANYLVKIKDIHFDAYCAGAILSHYNVITAALCIRNHVSNHNVISGGSYEERSNSHNITSSETYYGSPPHQSIDGIALLTVDPPFVYSAKTGYIGMHALAFLPPGTGLQVFGWGFSYPLQPGTESRSRLRNIRLPLMNHGECRTAYHGVMHISDKHICTSDPQQYCARNDQGAPLVLNRILVGIHVFKGETPGRRNPDVFVNLQRADYGVWVTQHTLLL